LISWRYFCLPSSSSATGSVTANRPGRCIMPGSRTGRVHMLCSCLVSLTIASSLSHVPLRYPASNCAVADRLSA
jgi:hypothetical protein